MIRKKFLSFLFLFFSFSFLLPLTISAQEGSQVTPEETEETNSIDLSDYEEAKSTTSGSLYVTGEDDVIEEDIANDLIYAGGELVLNGDVLDNIIVAGGAVEINGEVNGDILFAGGTLVLNGDVLGDVRAFGGAIFINSEVVAGDILAAGGQISISQNSDVRGEIDADGWNIEERATNNPTTLEEASSMDLPFSSNTFNSAITGLVVGFTLFAVVWAILMLIGTVISGYFILRVFPTFSEKTLETMQKSPWNSVGVGCLTFVVGFIAAILLLISVVGIRLLFVLMLLGVIAFMFGSIYGKYMIGRMALKRLGRDNPGRLLTLIVGVVIVDLLLGLLAFLPVLGGLIGIITFGISLWGLGAIVMNKYNALYNKPKEKSEKKTKNPDKKK